MNNEQKLSALWFVGILSTKEIEFMKNNDYIIVEEDNTCIYLKHKDSLSVKIFKKIKE